MMSWRKRVHNSTIRNCQKCWEFLSSQLLAQKEKELKQLANKKAALEKAEKDAAQKAKLLESAISKEKTELTGAKK